MSNLERWLSPSAYDGACDTCDTPPKAAETLGHSVAKGCRTDMRQRATQDTIANVECRTVSHARATPAGDTQSEAGRGFQAGVARVARLSRSVSAEAGRQREFNAQYSREFWADPRAPAGPCPSCGDRVFHTMGEHSPWRCRTCEPAAGGVQVWRWYVAPALRRK
jgi:hypothetical protein